MNIQAVHNALCISQLYTVVAAGGVAVFSRVWMFRAWLECILCAARVVWTVQNVVSICTYVCVFACHQLLQRLLPAQEGEQFKADFDGFHMREEMYTKFPDSHFHWRTIFLVVRGSAALSQPVE